MNNAVNSIKIGLSVILLLCLLDWPYSYYQFVRFSCMAGFLYLAYDAYRHEQTGAVVIFIALALLFQPFEKILLGRMIWNLVDVLVAIGLLLSLIASKKD
jgi:hypothetical protein